MLLIILPPWTIQMLFIELFENGLEEQVGFVRRKFKK